MEEIISTYGVVDVIVVICAVIIFIKKAIEIIDWFKARGKKVYDEEANDEKQHKDYDDRITKLEENNQVILQAIQKLIEHDQKDDGNYAECNRRLCALEEGQATTTDLLNMISKKLDDLMESDLDSLKAHITNAYNNFCKNQGWIDTYSLDCIIRLYDRYKSRGGNSFVSNLVEEMKDLPRTPPQAS